MSSMKKYNTIINYIEPTKILQRVTVDTFNNTYPLGHEYEASNVIYSNTDGVNNNGDYLSYDCATIDKVYGGNISQTVDLDNLYKNLYYIEVNCQVKCNTFCNSCSNNSAGVWNFNTFFGLLFIFATFSASVFALTLARFLPLG